MNKARGQRIGRWAAAVTVSVLVNGLMLAGLAFRPSTPPPPSQPSIEILLLRPDRPRPPPDQQTPRPAQPLRPRPFAPVPAPIAPFRIPAPAPTRPANEEDAGEADEEDKGRGGLALGCLGLNLDSMTPSQRRACERERIGYAQYFGAPNAADGPNIPADKRAAYDAAAAARAARNAPVYPAGNSSTIGCPEGNMTGCTDEILVPLIGKKF